MTDEPLNLGFEEASVAFASGAQNARVWTEQWAGLRLFCPNCGAARLGQFPGNCRVADFFCELCSEEYELKSSKTRFGRKVVDGAFNAMCDRLAAANNPNLVLMNYDLARFGVTNLFFIPKQFFVREIIQERRPLARTARRAGWIGCNILLGEVPEAGKVFLVRDREPVPKPQVLEQWRRTLFLKHQSLAARGWLIEVMKCVDLIGRRDFSLDDVYGQEARLRQLYPNNRHVRPKILPATPSPPGPRLHRIYWAWPLPADARRLINLWLTSQF